MSLKRKKCPSVTRRCRHCVVAVRSLVEICIDDISAVLRATEISAALRQLGWIGAPHTQNFENLKSLE
jgi:hypothetical protein